MFTLLPRSLEVLPYLSWILHVHFITSRNGLCWGLLVFVRPTWCGHQPAVSAALWLRQDKFTRTTEILWRKRDDTAAHSVKERACPVPCLDRLLLLFWTHYIEDGPHLLCRFAFPGYLLQTTKERMLLITSKRKDIYKCEGKSGWTGYTWPWEV